MTIQFKNKIDLNELLKKHGHSFDEYVTMQIGHDGNIYILFNKNIPERIDGMFVPTESNSSFSVLALQIDWEDEKIVSETYYPLGIHKMNYHFIQPVPEGFLLVSARCSYRKGDPEKNAVIVDHEGKNIEEFCLGDGISHCLVHPELGIVTGYFDEGIFGNYGWTEPLGSCGVRVWGRGSRDIWKADRSIYECYAMTVSDAGDLWYYYYDEFKIVKTNIKDSREMEYDPGINGAAFLIISEDDMTLIMDKGYDANDQLTVRKILYDKLGDEVPVTFLYQGEDCNVYPEAIYGSRAAFVDNRNGLFVKRF